MTFLLEERREIYHKHLIADILVLGPDDVPSNADKDSALSVGIARHLCAGLGAKVGVRQKGQTAGNKFEKITEAFIRDTFPHFGHLRPGRWEISRGAGREGVEAIARYQQYYHLAAIELAAKANPDLAVSIGNDYVIAPDIVITREPESDAEINRTMRLVGPTTGRLSALRSVSNRRPILHASISCKWTIRSDRSQNVRSEGQNLIRTRKGRAPHIVAVTAEPEPRRISSIALGTGDIDCVYHFALPELRHAVAQVGDRNSVELLEMMVDGGRIRDIADLPLDLLI